MCFTYLHHRAGLSPVEQTRQMSDLLALMQLHSRWLQRTNQSRPDLLTANQTCPELVTANQHLPELRSANQSLDGDRSLLTTLQNSVNCFYHVLSDGQYL